MQRIRIGSGLLGFGLWLLLTTPLTYAQVLAPAVGRIDPLTPITPTKVSRTTPPVNITPAKPIISVTQQIEQINENTYRITTANLNFEEPLPNTSLTATDLNQHAQLTPTVKPPNLQQVTPPKGATLKARIEEHANGTKTLQLRGTSPGTHMQLTPVAGLTITPPAPPKPAAVPAPTKPKPVHQTFKLAYFADSLVPENQAAFLAFLQALPPAKPTRFRVIAQNPPAVLEAFATLPADRWAWVKTQLAAADISIQDVPTSEILLTHTGASFLDLKLTYAP